MNTTTRIASGFAIASLCASAPAQFSASPTPTPTPKASAFTSTTNLGGGFSMGVDDCSSAHTNAGTGNVAGVPYTTGTTGTTGQNEGLCLFFGLTGIESDVWCDWTATTTGTATLDTCGSGTDTKVAIYPLSTCPADGSAIACNDDSCGLRSGVSWGSASGTTYTIQLGTFPGAAGGSGTLDITQSGPRPCGQKDDGTDTGSMGLTAGGEVGWLTVWERSIQQI